MEERLLSWDLVQPGAFPRLLEVRGARVREKALKLFHMTEEAFNALFISSFTDTSHDPTA
jgi:hypothetical protein